MNRYQKEIHRIIYRQDPIKIISRPFEPKDFHNLPGIITTYLNAKARNHILSDAEERFLAADDTQDPDALDDISLDPSWSQTEFLSELGEQAMVDLLDYEHFDDHCDSYHERIHQIEEIGQTLSASDLNYLSFTPHPGWVSVPTEFLNHLLIGYTQQNTLSQNDIVNVFDQRMAHAFWPLKTDLSSKEDALFLFECLETQGYWIVNLIDLLKAQVDPDICNLLISWLRWFKHEKTFQSKNITIEDQADIRRAKQIISLLKNNQIDQAAKPMIEWVVSSWE